MSVASITPPPRTADIARVFAPDTLLQFALGFAVIATGVALAVTNIYVAAVFTFVTMFAIALVLPSSTPFLLVFAFLLQNTFIAFSAPWVDTTDTLDQMRGLNLVMLVATFACFIVTGQFSSRTLPRALRPWINLNWFAMFVVAVYFAIGIALGNGKDAVIYLRGILTPLLCLQIALACGARYRVPLAPPLLVATLLIIAYGYSELVFEIDFLALFHGDRYLWLKMQQDVTSGFYSRLLAETGFVLRGVDDMMQVSLFNITGAERDAIKIFRLSGPNFHPISYGYALALLSTWLFALRVRWVALLALPLLVFVGSKGATVLFVFFFAMVLAVRVLPARIATALFLVVLVAYVAAVTALGIKVGDFHVLGLMAGIRDFFINPLGNGIGSGGVMSDIRIDWQRAQALGATDVPVESAIAVLLYQMGLGTAVFVGLLMLLARHLRRAFISDRAPLLLFGFVTVSTICANAFFQEEAFFAPLALGLCLMLAGLSVGALANGGGEAVSEQPA